MKLVQSLSTLLFALVLSAAAFADDLSTPGDPERLGFSARRLARIAAWYQERVDAITPSDPILDFENGEPVVLSPLSDLEFFVGADDHTRIAFVRDAAGKGFAAVLKPGPWEQKGLRRN